MAVTTYKALDIINSALRLIQTIGGGESCNATEAQDYLSVLNQMLDTWNAESLSIYGQNISTFPLVPAQQVYTLGEGGNFALTPRPERITLVSVQSTAIGELPIQYTTDEGEWQAVQIKTLTSPLPQFVYDDGGYPLRRLSFYPIPSAALNTIIYSWSALAAFVDLVTPYSFPPAYIRAIRFNLALDLAAENGVDPVPAIVVDTARRSKRALQNMNTPSLAMKSDEALVGNDVGTYNWLTDNAGR